MGIEEPIEEGDSTSGRCGVGPGNGEVESKTLRRGTMKLFGMDRKFELALVYTKAGKTNEQVNTVKWETDFDLEPHVLTSITTFNEPRAIYARKDQGDKDEFAFRIDESQCGADGDLNSEYVAVLGIEATPTPTPTPQLTEEEMAQAEAAASALSSGGQTANGGEAPMSEDDKVTMSGGDQGTSSTSGNGNVNNDDTDKEPLPDSIPIPGS